MGCLWSVLIAHLCQNSVCIFLLLNGNSWGICPPSTESMPSDARSYRIIEFLLAETTAIQITFRKACTRMTKYQQKCHILYPGLSRANDTGGFGSRLRNGGVSNMHYRDQRFLLCSFRGSWGLLGWVTVNKNVLKLIRGALISLVVGGSRSLIDGSSAFPVGSSSASYNFFFSLFSFLL